MLSRSPHNPTAHDDDFEDQPAQGFFHQWVLGAALPVALLAYGLHAATTREATLTGSRQSMPLHGTNALALAVAAIALAVFLHCHYFWGNVLDQAWFAVLGKILAACAFIAALGTLLVRVGVWGIT